MQRRLRRASSQSPLPQPASQAQLQGPHGLQDCGAGPYRLPAGACSTLRAILRRFLQPPARPQLQGPRPGIGLRHGTEDLQDLASRSVGFIGHRSYHSEPKESKSSREIAARAPTEPSKVIERGAMSLPRDTLPAVAAETLVVRLLETCRALAGDNRARGPRRTARGPPDRGGRARLAVRGRS